ncbi:hypothetical protein GCM10020254_40930 [Streptomyces goshikiensis]
MSEAGMAMDEPARLEVDRLLDDRETRIIVCCGSGGVGKTTTAAALGLRAAERGRRAVVLTIDPARRLAQSMGIDSLDNTPRKVTGVGAGGDGAGGDGDGRAPGELHAMMLDMKRTFDEIVEGHTDPERAEAILANPFYQSLSAGFAGTQGVHGDGEAGAAPGPGRLGPDRRGHPAEPVRAGLPGRAEAPGVLPGREVHPGADGPPRRWAAAPG